jgi:hypothetical protein
MSTKEVRNTRRTLNQYINLFIDGEAEIEQIERALQDYRDAVLDQRQLNNSQLDMFADVDNFSVRRKLAFQKELL